VHAPAWPDGPDIGIATAVDHFDGCVRNLPEPPIVMGHSMGGLITQMPLDRRAVCCG
jgi:alpha-beta hydrolase superfamily lysophospholipase